MQRSTVSAAASDRERKLEDHARQPDRRTYGACAQAGAMSLILRVGALASLADPGPVTLALIAANAGARAMVPMFLRLVPAARPDGLSAGAGRPTQSNGAVAVLMGLVVLLCELRRRQIGLVALLLLLLGLAGFMRWLCLRQIGADRPATR